MTRVAARLRNLRVGRIAIGANQLSVQQGGAGGRLVGGAQVHHQELGGTGHTQQQQQQQRSTIPQGVCVRACMALTRNAPHFMRRVTLMLTGTKGLTGTWKTNLSGLKMTIGQR